MREEAGAFSGTEDQRCIKIRCIKTYKDRGACIECDVSALVYFCEEGGATVDSGIRCV